MTKDGEMTQSEFVLYSIYRKKPALRKGFAGGRSLDELRHEAAVIDNEATRTIDAVFVGWQENLPGKPPIALYSVEKPDSPLYKSTVSAKTLTENGLSFRVPDDSSVGNGSQHDAATRALNDARLEKNAIRQEAS
jgi:hypothetical protein